MTVSLQFVFLSNRVFGSTMSNLRYVQFVSTSSHCDGFEVDINKSASSTARIEILECQSELRALLEPDYVPKESLSGPDKVSPTPYHGLTYRFYMHRESLNCPTGFYVGG